MKPFYWFSKTACHLFFKSLLGLRVRGLENVPATGPVILASNHTSYYDPPLVGSSITWRECHYLAKKELFDNRLFGMVLGAVNAFPVDREKLDPSTIKTIFRVLRSGGGLLMFPEGTRRTDGVLGPFKTGVAAIALKTGAVVVPAWVTDSYEGIRRRLRGRPATLVFGPPMYPADFEAVGTDQERIEEFNRVLRDRMVELSQSWK